MFIPEAAAPLRKRTIAGATANSSKMTFAARVHLLVATAVIPRPGPLQVCPLLWLWSLSSPSGDAAFAVLAALSTKDVLRDVGMQLIQRSLKPLPSPKLRSGYEKSFLCSKETKEVMNCVRRRKKRWDEEKLYYVKPNASVSAWIQQAGKEKEACHRHRQS